MHFFTFSGNNFQQGVGDDTSGNTVCDAVGKRHQDKGKECGEAFGKVAEIDIKHR